MNSELKIVIFGCIVFILGMTFLLSTTQSRPASEVVNKSIQELSKSCIETHNGTFTVNFMVGDVNQIEYQCVIGAK